MRLVPEQPVTVVRKEMLAPKVVIVDGQAGCGKTLFSPILSSLKRVEMYAYAFEMEWVCRLRFLKGITDNAAETLVRMLIDKQLYNMMMSREVNFRWSDLSGVRRAVNPWCYIKRLFSDGDMAVPQKIIDEQPILNLATHNLLPVAQPVFEGLGDRLAMIEVVRHPLFMLVQQTLNMERLINNPRDISIFFEHDDSVLPYYAFGAKREFLSAPPVDQAIFAIQYQTRLTKQFKRENNTIVKGRLLTIPFERFVLEPSHYMPLISDLIASSPTAKTAPVMRRQRVPRTNIVDGIPLAIYKRCGWQPPQKELTERQECEMRRQFAVDQGASKECLTILDDLSHEYESEFQVF